MASITHIIFDFDGTLVDTVDKATEVLDRYIHNKFGVHINKQVREYVPNLESLEELCEKINTELNVQLDAVDFRRSYLPQVHGAQYSLMPGVERLVKHLHGEGIAMAVATGNSSQHYSGISSQFGTFFTAHMHHVICGWDDDRVVRKKPFPDVYQVCAQQFEPPPKSMQDVLIIEDSITGVKGALQSGAHTLMVLNQHSHQTSQHNRDVWSKAVQIIDSLLDFEPQKFNLPPFP